MDWDEIYRVVDTETDGRRTKEQIAAIDRAIELVVNEYDVITVRQLFYQLVSRGVIEKSERAYKGLVVRRSGLLRQKRRIPFSKFADATRWQRKPQTYDDLSDAMWSMVFSYRKALWADQDTYCEVWCEKDALAGVIYETTEEYDVPLMVSRGYSSLTFLHTAAEAIREAHSSGKRVVLYHCGDYDPSGQDAARAIRDTLGDMAQVPFEFEQLAVTPAQIDLFGLPTRPTKKTDSRAKNWVGGSVELDAIDPATLQELVANALDQHLDQQKLAQAMIAEKAEKESLKQFAMHWQS